MNRQAAAKKFWDRSYLLSTKNRRYREYIMSYFDKKIKKDMIRGDITTETIISKQNTTAVIKAKQDCVIAGIEEITYFLSKTKLKYIVQKKDGSKIKKNETIISLQGSAHTILKIERTILNLLQRMSGIATQTRELSIKSNPYIAATRKTILDIFDKKAVSVVGGLTHRLNASDFVLIKDTHLDIMENNIPLILKKASKKPQVEIEISDTTQAIIVAKEISKYPKTKFAVMLDNMSPKEIRSAIHTINKESKRQILFEASGGIHSHNISSYAKTGVDCISIGAITHSAHACDFSLKIKE